MALNYFRQPLALLIMRAALTSLQPASLALGGKALSPREFGQFITQPFAAALAVTVVVLVFRLIGARISRAGGLTWKDFYLAIPICLATLSACLSVLFDTGRRFVVPEIAPARKLAGLTYQQLVTLSEREFDTLQRQQIIEDGNSLFVASLALVATFGIMYVMSEAHRALDPEEHVWRQRVILGLLANVAGFGWLVFILSVLKGTF